ncbi:MAG: hypothetical protein RLZZ04_4904 [Cyanobacteriota bacterium]|jgi:rare lipoprotein A
MINKSKYSKVMAITAFLPTITILLNSSIATAQTNIRKEKFSAKTSALSVAKKQQNNSNLFFNKKSSNQISKKYSQQDPFKLSEINQTIALPEQVLIANTVNGNASWYGPGFDGRLTANGETFDQQEMTAAHPHLEFGTKVKVTNLQNGRSVVVRINDRGPFIRDRIIDLSAAAARALNMMSSGVAPVRLTILGR